MKKLLFMLCVTAFLGGCSPFVPVVNIEKLPDDQRAVIENMPVYEQHQLTNLKYSTISQVEGISCKDLMWSPDATTDNAINQAKYWALQKGANAISNLNCESKEGVSFSKNCWESIRCTADAIEIKK